MPVPKNIQDNYIQMYKHQASMIETLVLELGNKSDNTRDRKVAIMTAITNAVNGLVHDLEIFVRKED